MANNRFLQNSEKLRFSIVYTKNAPIPAEINFLQQIGHMSYETQEEKWSGVKLIVSKKLL